MKKIAKGITTTGFGGLALFGAGYAVADAVPEFYLFGIEYAQCCFYLIAGSAALTVGGVTTQVCTHLKGKVEPAARMLKGLIIRNWIWSYSVVTYQQLPDTFEKLRDKLGDDISPLETMKAWLKKNSDILWTVTRRRMSSPPQIEGVFEVIPVTLAAVKKLERCNLDGRSLSLKHVASDNKKRNSFYIGSIVSLSDNPILRGLVIAQFQAFLENLSADRDIVLYTRPVTKRGLSLVRLYQFEKIDENLKDSVSIWKKTISAGQKFESLTQLRKKAEEVEIPEAQNS